MYTDDEQEYKCMCASLTDGNLNDGHSLKHQSFSNVGYKNEVVII